ncbi:MAG: metallophosphoesterase family protein [Candidatus Wallbacteria bacterium]|nr:metallophosphoesterase family protein [Candidatus Wallbacteria bacterium]
MLNVLIFWFWLCCLNCQAATRILVLGDLQIQGTVPLELNRETAVTDWKGQKLASEEFGKSLKTLITASMPDMILQTGDFVEFNESLKIACTGEAGTLEIIPYPVQEWRDTLQFFPGGTDIYTTPGNHDTLKETLFKAHYTDPGKSKFVVDGLNRPPSYLSFEERKDLQELRFPNLKGKLRLVLSPSSYLAYFSEFNLLSLDGDEIQKSNSVLEFFASQMPAGDQKPLIILCHYPIYPGRKKNNAVSGKIAQALLPFLNTHNCVLYLSGHEHYYLRYADESLRNMYTEIDAPTAKFVTVGNFCCKEPDRYDFNPKFGNKKDYYLYEGPNYAEINIDEEKLEFKAYGKYTAGWEKIDSFTLVFKSEAAQSAETEEVKKNEETSPE